VWNDGIDSIRADLREWLRRATEDGSGFLPWRFELSFGLPERRPRDPHSVADAVGLACGLRLRGSIDLIERDGSGHLRVTDHKTGRTVVPEQTVIHGGRSLQPVLYALAAEQLFRGQRVVSGRLYYCTTAGGFAEREVELDDGARKAAERVALTIKGALETGFLPAAPDKDACKWCDYNCVCGHAEERRVKRKPPGRLLGLKKLREQA
jgi:ATP-dependent helicase/nuclease subunit B